MKKQILFPALLLLGFTTVITSCKKKKDENVNPTNPIASCVVSRAITNEDSTQATYDSENRLIKDQTFGNTGASEGYSLYTYTTGKITEQSYGGDGNLDFKIDYHLNSNNHTSYSVYVEDGDTENADTTWYQYDGSNHNVRRATKSTSTVPVIGTKVITYDTTWYTYTEDNLSKIVSRNNDGDTETTVYSYGTADAKTKILVPAQHQGIVGLFGNSSSKLPVSQTQGSTTLTYDYQFNNEGYVTRYQINIPASNPEVVRFVYNCK